jgi:predicted phosphoribosyltransferase
MPASAPAPAALDRLFDDRSDAGRRLAPQLAHYVGSDALIVALPCGGVPVGYEIASATQLSMNVLPTKRIPTPDGAGAIGALAFGGEPVLDAETIEAEQLSTAQIKGALAALRLELGDQEHRFRSRRLPRDLGRRPLILVDDGVGTGWTVRAAIGAVRARNPGPVVVAAPIASAWACAALAPEVEQAHHRLGEARRIIEKSMTRRAAIGSARAQNAQVTALLPLPLAAEPGTLDRAHRSGAGEARRRRG